MAIDLNRISIILLNPEMTDQQLKEEILFIRQYNVKMVIVLPWCVVRAKQLLEGTPTLVGSVADYPFGAGTLAKQSFEIGELYRNGATEVHLTATLENLANSKQIYQMFTSVSLGKGPLGFFIDFEKMADEERNKLVFQMGRVNVKTISLGTALSVENALSYIGMFRAVKGRPVAIQINVNSPTLLEMELLLQEGANTIGVNNPREILPLFD